MALSRLLTPQTSETGTLAAPSTMTSRDRAPTLASLPRPGAGPRSSCPIPPARCAGCGLHEVDCLCDELPRIALRTRLVLLMHRDETRKSTNTGRLAARMLEGSEVRIRGEQNAAVRAPLPEGRRLLLYPSPDARVLSAEDATTQHLVLLVPDGTWNQTRRIARRDEDALGAEQVTLPPGLKARVGLRRNPHATATCTLEAIARALGILEGPWVERCMLEALDTFVARAQRAAGRLPRPPVS